MTQAQTNPRSHTSRRRLFGIAGGSALVGVLAAACGAGGTASSPSATAQTGTPGCAGVQGRLQVVQVLDFHPDHNAFLAKAIDEYTAQQSWPLDRSDLSGFLGGTDIYQKLQAQKSAGQPVDLIFHGLSARRMKFFDLTRDVTPLVNKMAEQYGRPYSSARATHQVDGQWVGLPFYDRVGGFFVREDKMREAGINVETGLERWEQVREASLRISKPEERFYGWGTTVNRSGDGESLTWTIIQSWGGALADTSGEVVTLNSRETVDAVSWLAAVYMDERFKSMLPPGVNSWNDTSNNEAYLAGQVGFTSNAGTLYAKAVLDGNPVAEATTLIQQPLGPGNRRLQGSGGHYFYFMNGSRNFEPAAQLSEHLLSDPVQKELWRISAGYVVPANEKRWEDPLVAGNRISTRFKPVAFNEPPFVGVAWRGPITEASEAVSTENVITDMMGEILGGKPVAQAVREAHERAVGLYQTFGLKGR